MPQVVALEGCTLGSKYVRPSVPTTPASKEQAPPIRSVETGSTCGSNKSRQLVGGFWRSGTQPTGRADRELQPSAENIGSAVPRSSRSGSLQSGCAVPNHLHHAERQSRTRIFLTGFRRRSPQGKFRAALRSFLR